MPSRNTLYVEYLKAPAGFDQTVGFYVDGNKIYGQLGLDATTANWEPLGSTDPLTRLQLRFIPQVAAVGYTELDAGQYHPRFYRGGFNPSYDNLMRPIDTKIAMMAEERIDILDTDLTGISRVATPSTGNKDTYGAVIGNTLRQACSDVESQLKGILLENGYQSGHPKGYLSTNDYVKVCKPLRLEEYSVRLMRHEGYPEVTPFRGWNAGAPTASLPWYDAYNAIKHDQEKDFHRGTLEHVIGAVAALHVLVLAQWGATFMRQISRDAFFTLSKYPRWEHKDRTFAPPPGSTWTKLPYQF